MLADRPKSGRFRNSPGRAPVVAFALILLCAAAAMVLAGGGWVVLRAPHRAWVVEAITSRLFIVCGLITLGCVVGLGLIGGMLWRAGAAQRLRNRNQDGQVILEFAMVLPIALMLALVMTQSSLLMGGNLCVHYAAYCAARSAIVQVPANATAFEPPNIVIPDLSSSQKQQRVRMAAAWAVFPVSCGHKDYPADALFSPLADSLADGLEKFFKAYSGAPKPSWVNKEKFARKLTYAWNKTTVDLAPPADGVRYVEHEDLHLTVTHDLYLAVPYANWFFTAMDSRNGGPLDFGTGQYMMRIKATCALTNEGGQDFVEPESFPQ